jgi:beta-aspartyl-peptidase (threonine type)
MRFVVAHDISAMMEYGGLSLEEATRRVIHGKLRAGGGDGGVIAVDREGNVATPFNTKIMLRGVVTDRKPPEVSVY